MTAHEKAVKAATDILWPLQEWEGDKSLASAAAAAAISAYLASMREQGWVMMPTEGATLEEVRKLLEDAKKAFDEIAMLAAQESQP